MFYSDFDCRKTRDRKKYCCFRFPVFIFFRYNGNIGLQGGPKK